MSEESKLIKELREVFESAKRYETIANWGKPPDRKPLLTEIEKIVEKSEDEKEKERRMDEETQYQEDLERSGRGSY